MLIYRLISRSNLHKSQLLLLILCSASLHLVILFLRGIIVTPVSPTSFFSKGKVWLVKNEAASLTLNTAKPTSLQHYTPVVWQWHQIKEQHLLWESITPFSFIFFIYQDINILIEMSKPQKLSLVLLNADKTKNHHESQKLICRKTVDDRYF